MKRSHLITAAVVLAAASFGLTGPPATATTSGTTVFTMTSTSSSTTVKITTAGNHQVAPRIYYYQNDNNAHELYQTGSYVSTVGARSTVTKPSGTFFSANGFVWQ